MTASVKSKEYLVAMLFFLLILLKDGFRKVAKPEQGVLAGGVHDYDVVEFWHTNFRKNHPELLPLVQRRVCASSPLHVCLPECMHDMRIS